MNDVIERIYWRVCVNCSFFYRFYFKESKVFYERGGEAGFWVVEGCSGFYCVNGISGITEIFCSKDRCFRCSYKSGVLAGREECEFKERRRNGIDDLNY